MSDRFEAGQKRRRQVLGDAHVDRSLGDGTAWDAPLQALVTESAWGHAWAGDQISLRERSMLVLALLAAAGNMEEFELHLRATARTGASAADVLEVLKHVAAYAGAPRALPAARVAKRVLAEMGAI